MDDFYGEKKLAELRVAFNKLPRPSRCPDGASNRWEFSIRSVPGNIFDTLVHIFNPESGFSHFERSPRPFHKTIDVTAKWTVPLLMKAFLTSFDKIHEDDGVTLFAPRSWAYHTSFDKVRKDDGLSLFAPGIWNFSDAAMASELEKVLVSMKVRKELCAIETGSANEQLEQEAWVKLGKRLTTIGMNSNKCQFCQTWGTKGHFLSLCSGCRKVYYCCKEHQKEDWKRHKPVCKKDGESKEEPAPSTRYDYTQEQYLGVVQETAFMRPENERSLAYFRKVAALKPEVQALAKRIKFPIPGPNQGLTPIIRRLVITGEDTQENHALLFGTPMDTQARLFCLESRLEVLLDPPSGSPVGERLLTYEREGRGLDEHWPWWTWKVREPSAEERGELAKIRKIQETTMEWLLIQARRFGGLHLDEREILERLYGERWKEQRRRFQKALSTMDIIADMKMIQDEARASLAPNPL